MRYFGKSFPNTKVVLTVIAIVLVAAAAAATHPGTWAAREDLPERLYLAAIAEVDGIIYTIGGSPGEGVVATVLAFDPLEERWLQEERAPMPTPRSMAAAAVVDGKIYVIGGSLGLSEFAVTSVVEVYDPAADSWETKIDIPTARWGAAAAAIDGKIYVLGGAVGDAFGDRTILSTVEVFDPSDDSWDTAADMPTARAVFGAPSIGGKIFAGGGSVGNAVEQHSVTGAFEVYDSATDSWSEAAPMPTPRTSHAAIALDDEIHVFGGFAFDDLAPLRGIRDVEVFDPSTNIWERSTVMPDDRWGLGAAVVDDTIYLIGGGLEPLVLNGSTYVDAYDPDLYTSWTEAAAHLPGAFGSQWRTDIWAANMEDESANVEIILHSLPPMIYHSLSDTIEATQQKAFTDVVGTMEFEGKAMLSVRSDQPLHSAGRLYSQDDDGTFGQLCQFRTMDDGFAKSAVVYLTGLRQEEGLFRTNLLFANSGIREASLMVQLFSGTGDAVATFMVVKVQPGKIDQWVEVFANEGGQPNVGWGYAKITVLEGAGVRISASVIDSRTNDATTIVAER